MSIQSVTPLQPAGLTSVVPSVIYILTNDTYATVTTTGYLTQSAQLGNTYNNQQMALVYTTDNGPVWLKVAITYSGATVLNSVVSLVQISSPGDVVLPTVANNLVIATDTQGTLATTSIASAAVMQLTAVNTMSGSGQIILVKANGTEAANAVTASGNAGVITTSALTTAAGASYAITWTNTKITATSVIGLCIQGGTNTVNSVQFKCVPGAGSATLTIYNVGPTDPLNGTILLGYTVL